MDFKRCFTAVAACLAYFCVVIPVEAQPSVTQQAPSVSVSGSSTIKRLPDSIRVIVTVQGKGKTIDEALKNLQNEEKSAIAKLQKIGFVKDKIKIEDYDFDDSQENKQRQMQMMVAQRMRKTGPQKPVESETVSLQCFLFAEWSIPVKTVEEILKESYTLKQKVKAANLVPKKEELTPEEEEMEEEMESMHYPGEPESSREPRFVYVSNITEEERQQAYTEAYGNARKQGQILAKAAGANLGGLINLTGFFANTQRSTPNSYRGNDDYFLMQMIHSQRFNDGNTEQTESVGTTPAEIEFTFSVNVTFGIQP